MAYTPMSMTGADFPNLVNVASRMDPDGGVSALAEILNQSNPILTDIPLVEGNLPTGHRVSVRTGIPAPTWRITYKGVPPGKSTSAQVDESIAMLEAYGEVDKDLALLNGNTADFRLTEDRAHIEGMSQAMATGIFYADTTTDPEKFLGLAPRYSTLGTPANKFTAQTNSAYLKHIIGAGGTTASAQTSVWYICWGQHSVFGIYPKGSKAGLMSEDLGEVTLMDDDGGRFQGFRSHYQWKLGLCVKDWRCVVRIGNVELANMADATAQKDLYQAMIRAMHTVPAGTSGSFYCSPGVAAMLDMAAVEKSNAALGYTEIFGKTIPAFRGRPIRECNAILETESVLTA